MGLLTGEVRSATVRAKGLCHLIVVDHDAFHDSVLASHPEVVDRLGVLLAARQAELVQPRPRPRPRAAGRRSFAPSHQSNTKFFKLVPEGPVGTAVACGASDAEPLAAGTRFTSDVPGRMDRLPWSGWHLRVVAALGIRVDARRPPVTLVGAVAPGRPGTLALTDSQIGGAATAYLAGAVIGALVFGRLTDAFGRKRLFLVTLSLYAGATLLTALAWNFASLALFRALTGAGIGGEYSAVNSAIDELIPARLRGRIDLLVNGTYWLGTALGAALTVVLLDPRLLPHVEDGARYSFSVRYSAAPFCFAPPRSREPAVATSSRARR